MKSSKSIQVLMYHSIGIPNEKWNWNYLTCPYQIFEKQLITLKKNGYTTISLKELYDFMLLGTSLPENSIVLTFDDGYLDNWVFAYPLLKKYGMKGTVFINPEFVDKRDVIRKRFDQGTNVTELETEGFLSWNELQIMDKEAVILVESHAMTHTWYPNSNKIIDFRHPSDNYLWMTWNNNVSEKPFLQMDNTVLVNYGEPVYEHEKSLSARRFFPDERLAFHLIEFSKNNPIIFSNENYKKNLMVEVEKYSQANNLVNYYETENDYHNRIYYELTTSKEILEKKLNKNIFFLCWPGGSATKIGMKIAESVGYTFFNSARDMSLKERKKIRNAQNIKYNRIDRFVPMFYFNGTEDFNSKIIFSFGLYFIFHIKARENGGCLLITYKILNKLINFILKYKERLS